MQYQLDFAIDYPIQSKIFETRWPLVRNKLKELFLGDRLTRIKDLAGLYAGLNQADQGDFCCFE